MCTQVHVLTIELHHAEHDLHECEHAAEHDDHAADDYAVDDHADDHTSHRRLFGVHEWEETEHFLHSISVAILFIFLLEALLLIVAMGPSKFFHSPFYVLDIVVVTASIIFDFTDDHHREAGLLILPRLWRCARIIHGVYVVGHMEAEHMNEVIKEERLHEQSAADSLRAVRTLLPDTCDDTSATVDAAERKGLFTTKTHTLSLESAYLLAQHIDRAIEELDSAEAKKEAAKNRDANPPGKGIDEPTQRKLPPVENPSAKAPSSRIFPLTPSN